MLRSLALLAVLIEAASAQVTFSPQGPAILRTVAGAVVKNVQLIGVVACSDQPISGGAIFADSVAAGFSPFSVGGGDVLRAAAGHNWRVFAVRAVQVGTTVAAGLVGSGIISGNGKVITSLVTGHAIADQAVGWFQADTPNPNAVIAAIIDPTRRYQPAESGCIAGLLVAAYEKKQKYRAVTVPLNPTIAIPQLSLGNFIIPTNAHP